jgi:hypothetical protein
MNLHRAYHVGCQSPDECEIDRRALTLWPGLDRRALASCRHDAERIVRLVGRRTRLPPTAIRRLLSAPTVSREEVAIWFG